MTLDQLPKTGFLRVKQIVPGVLPVHKSTLYAWVRDGKFPAPIKLGEGVTVWRAEEIHAFIEKKMAVH